MGCVLAKLSLNSPRRTKKTKMDRGNVVREHAVKRYQTKTEDERRNGRMVTRDGKREGKGPSQRLPPPRPLPGPAVGKDADQMANGWPKWLVENIPREVLARLVPRSAECYDKLDKVGHGTYSNVFKARDRETGKIVALKKVRFDTTEPESVKFMAREIRILQKLDHPNVIKLEGLATSRMDYSLYLVFDFMPSDLSRVISRRDERLTEPQVKCYMHQLLSGLQHCHERGILHRDIKGSNLLIDRDGMLKIADFGLANFFKPNRKRPLTSKVVTLWYRAPELLLGARDYGVGIDLWSAGCLLAEMFAGRPIMPGRTEIEQLHRIFKLCGSPSDDYWIKLKLSKSLRSSQQYKPSITEAFRDFPASSLGLLNILLALDPSDRQNASSALQNEFFTTSPLASNLSDLPVIYKEEYNESIQPYERRKHRASKLSQMSHTQRESQRKKERAMEEKTAQLAAHKLGSSTASISSATQPKRHVRSPPTSPSSKAPQLGGQSRSTDGHPSATKNLPPLPSSETKDGGSDGDTRRMHRYGMDKSSVRSSSFGKLEREHRSQNYDFDY